jgi:hypothetical protein
MDEHQRMYVNRTMKKGKDLLTKVLNKKAKFPTEYSKNLTLSRLNMRMGSRNALNGYEYGKKAFEIDQTQAAMIQISFETNRYKSLLSRRAAKYVEAYVEDFKKNRAAKSKEGGYAKKLEAAYIGASYLSRVYEKKDAKKSKEYLQLTANFTEERKQIARDYKW